MPGPTKTSYFPLGGGLDLTTPALSVEAGRALALQNYEPWFNGGYRRIAGYERFDGSPKPSEQTFVGFQVSDASGLTEGDTVTGDSSAATGTVVGIWLDDGSFGSDVIGVTKVTGTFTNGEAVNTAAFTIDSLPIDGYAPTSILEGTWNLAAQDLYRLDIDVVPGNGDVNGVWQRDANVYAIRNNAGGTAGILHLASATGWTTTGVTMTDYIYFNTGGGGTAQPLPAEGATLTGASSGASGTVHRVITHGGATGTNDAYGYIVLTGVTGGPFTDTENLQVSAVTVAVADGDSETFAFEVGGHYQFVNKNFYGGSDTYRTYGVNGVSAPFEIDENNVVSPILLPLDPITDQPALNLAYLVTEHNNHLFLAYPGGSLVHSVQGEPMTINGFLGAAEFGIGDEITGLNSVTGQVLTITTGRQTKGLFGANITDWNLKLIGEKTGGKLFTPQRLDTIYAFDDLGITSMSRTDVFGDFVGATVSQAIQPLIALAREHITDSTIVRSSNQYRVYLDDGSGLIMYVPNAGADQRTQTRLNVHFGTLSYPLVVKKIYNTEDETGKERTYFASDDGFVYEDQIGNNFDGDAIAASMRTVFNKVDSPAYKKKWRRAVLELVTQIELPLQMIYELDFGDPNVGSADIDTTVLGSGGLYDAATWDDFFWDGLTVSSAVAPLTGSSQNMGILIYISSAYTPPFILQGITLHYDLRRLQR